MGFAPSKMKLRSTAFGAGGAIPSKHTGQGVDVSPELSWEDAPEGTRAADRESTPPLRAWRGRSAADRAARRLLCLRARAGSRRPGSERRLGWLTGGMGMVVWKRFGMAGAIVAAVMFAGLACGGSDGKAGGDQKPAEAVGPGNDGSAGSGGTGGGGNATGGNGAGGYVTGGSGAGGIATGGSGAGGIAGDGSGGSGGDLPPAMGELVVEKLFCREDRNANPPALDCDGAEVPMAAHVLITTVDAAGEVVVVFDGEIEEGYEYREIVEVGTYTIVETCDDLPKEIECLDPDPLEVTVAAGTIAEAKLIHVVDDSVVGGGGDGTTCEPLTVKVTRSCRRFSFGSSSCSRANVTVAVSGDAVESITFSRNKSSQVAKVPCGSFNLNASASRGLYICPSATRSNVSNGSTVTFQLSDRRCN